MSFFRQNLFDKTVGAKGQQTKDSTGTVRAFFTMITKRKQPRKVWVDRGTEFAGELKKYPKLKENRFTPQ